MNSSPYLVPALVFLAAVLAGCAAVAVLAVIARTEASEADGTGWWDEEVGKLPTSECRHDEPPQPPAVEILTGPGAPIRQTSETVISVLARARDKLPPEARKPEPGEATFTPADPDATLTDLRPADAPKYLAAPQ